MDKTHPLRKKALRTGAFFIFLLLVGGVMLLYKGNDAIALGMEKKEGILTAEQIKVAFDSVSGKLLKEDVKEGDYVKAGDALLELDPTDTDLAIERLKAQISQLEAQIQSTGGTQRTNYMRADNDEAQAHRDIDRQRAAIAAAEATQKNSQANYNRMAELYAAGAIAKSALDDAEMSASVATANVEQQNQALARLLAGSTDGQSLPTIEQERAAATNMNNDIEALRRQREALLVSLKELEVQKGRLILRAPEDGKVLKVLAKQGEMVQAGTPVILLESERTYYDIYISENQATNLAEGDVIVGETAVNGKKVSGTVRTLTQAPGFADLKQSREKGQADLTAFQVRIYTDPTEGVLPGMTIGVDANAFGKGQK